MKWLVVTPKVLKSITIPSAAFTTSVRPMIALLMVDPASAPVPTTSLAVAAAPNVTLSPRALPAVSLVPIKLSPTKTLSVPLPRVAFAPASERGVATLLSYNGYK